MAREQHTVVADDSSAGAASPTETWHVVHAEPGALVYALPGWSPPPLPRPDAGTAGWTPRGPIGHAETHHGGTGHPVLHYAGYIGRVGMLATALGVGAAVAGTSGRAWAEPATPSVSSSSSEASDAGSQPGRSARQSGSGSAAGDSRVSSRLNAGGASAVRAAPETGRNAVATGTQDRQARPDLPGVAVQAIPAVPEIAASVQHGNRAAPTPAVSSSAPVPTRAVASAPVPTREVSSAPAPTSAPLSWLRNAVADHTATPGVPGYTLGTADHSTGVVAGNLSVADVESVHYSLAGGPSQGAVTLDAATGAFTYTPSRGGRHRAAAESAGPDQRQDTFTVVVTDRSGGTTTVPVRVDVDPLNAAPAMTLVVSDPATDGTVHVSVIVTDPDDDPVTYLVVHDPAHGTLTKAADGYSYVPNAEARQTPGTDTFQISATDQHHGVVTETAIVTVGPVVAPAAARRVTTSTTSTTAATSATVLATATTTVTNPVVIEAESMVRNPSKSGSAYSDSTASGGRALLMSKNGTASTTLSMPASTNLVIRAKGDQYKGAPSMTVSVDGKAVATIAVSTTTWTDYTIPISTTAGTHTVSVAYTNELRASASKDRNLRIDKITVVTGVVTPPSTETPAYFPTADWLWKPIAANPTLAANSATWVSYLSAPGSKHIANMYNYGVTLVPSSAITTSTPRYDVRFTKAWGSDPFGSNTVAIPRGTRIPPGSDGHVAVLDPVTGQAYGIWQAKYDSATDTWSGSWGGSTPINGNGIDTSGSATAAGISRAAGVVTAAELDAAIAANTGLNHALVFSSDIAGPGFVGPAIKSDGSNMAGVATPIPEGYRIQLDPSINVDAIPNITPGEKVIAKTLQTHGAYVIDQGGARMAFAFETVPDATASSPGSVYTKAGFAWDYYDMSHIPWSQLRVIAA